MAPIPKSAAGSLKHDGGVYDSNRKTIALMGLNETSHMNADDSVACQSLEIFEAGQSETSDADLRVQYPSLTIGQLGLRCIHCSSSPKSVKEATRFPSSIADNDSLADGVRLLSEQHLGKCSMAPASVRDIHQQATEKRNRNNQEREHSWQEDEQSHAALRDWCYRFCQRWGIVDKGPEGAGLTYMQHAGDMMQVPQGAVGRLRPGPMGHMGADPLAPTPVARRRERSPMPNEGSECRSIAGGFGSSYVQGNEAYYKVPETAMMQRSSGQENLVASQNPIAGPTAGVSPHRGYQQQQMAPLGIPGNFPYFQEANGGWICKFCSHVPAPYRDVQAGWSAPNHIPPPPHYMDQHLNMCRAYHQAMPTQPMFQGGAPLQVPFMRQHVPSSFGVPQQPQGWEGLGTSAQSGQGYLYTFSHGSQATQPSGQRTIQGHAPYPHTPHQMSKTAKYSDKSSHGAVSSRAQTPINTTSAQRPNAADSAVQNAIDYLVASDREQTFNASRGVEGEIDLLVLDEDKLLLTDYFFYLMKQLRLCRFSEADRKTRGGKREKILIGFGGLQCIHCSEANNSRKFFWSNVDRLANSFAEIPGHVLKCRHCPQQTKDALFHLKQLHPEQMARLPRGSQKVFFRRMWRRLHDEDPPVPSPEQASPLQQAGGSQPGKIDTQFPAVPAPKPGNDASPSGTAGSDESILLMQRSTKEAAKSLADSASMSLPPSPTSRVLLAIPEDKEWLSDTDCFIRRQIEVFCANSDDVSIARSDRKFPVHKGQVGIRCIHCSLSKQGAGARGSGVAYPFSVSGIYESVREFQRLHLDSCDCLPGDMKAKLADLKGSTSLSSVLRKYYVLAAKALGLKDTREGIRAGTDSVPIGSQAAFAFSEGSQSISEEMHIPAASSLPEHRRASLTPAESRKRKQPQDIAEDAGSAKRSNSGST